MNIKDSILNIIACPITKQALRQASAQELRTLNDEIKNGNLQTASGRLISSQIPAALIREDKKAWYQIQAGIPVLLPEEVIIPAKPLLPEGTP